MKKLVLIPTLLLSATLVSGCAPDISPNSYDVASVGTVSKVVPATIIGMRHVQVNGNSGVGATAGAFAGGAIGSSMGNGGVSSLLTGVVGAVAAGAAGNAIDKSINSQLAMEYLVRTDQGKILSIVQGRDIKVHINERVFVLFGPESKIIPEDVYLGRKPANSSKPGLSERHA